MKINYLDYLHDAAKQVVKNKLNPTAEYADWIKLTIAAASYGEEARKDYLTVCSTYPNYSEEECNEKFDNCLKSADGKRKGKMLYDFFEEHDIHVEIPKHNAQQERIHLDAVKDEEMIRKYCPTLDASVFEKLCSILHRSMEIYLDHKDTYSNRMRDVLFLCNLHALTNCFPTVRLPYDTDRYSLNTYFIIVGESSSGKRFLKYAILLLGAIDKAIIDEYSTEHREWKKREENWNFHKKKRKKNEELDYSLEPGEEPKFRCFIIPANTSKSMIIDIMKASENYGNVLSTTELVTYNVATKQECGQFDDVLLKAHGNEPIDKAFRIDGNPVRIDFPMLGVDASGTKDQAHQFIKTYETGLGSRIPVYYSEQADDFYKTKPQANLKDYNKVYGEIAEDVLHMWNYFRRYNFVIEFTDEQWEDHYNTWHGVFDTVKEEQRGLLSVTTRSASYLMRLAATLTMLRLYDDTHSTGILEDSPACTKDAEECYHIVCSDTDYFAASNIAQAVFQHCMMFAASKVKRENPFVKNMEEWRWQYRCLEQMNETFTSTDFIHAAINDYGKSDKAAYAALSRLAKGKGRKVRQLREKVNGQRMFKKVKQNK